MGQRQERCEGREYVEEGGELLDHGSGELWQGWKGRDGAWRSQPRKVGLTFLLKLG